MLVIRLWDKDRQKFEKSLVFFGSSEMISTGAKDALLHEF